MQEDVIWRSEDRLRDQALTTLEWRVTRLVSVNYSTMEIARTLSISDAAVYDHLAHIYQKLSIDGEVELTRWYIANTMSDPVGLSITAK